MPMNGDCCLPMGTDASGEAHDDYRNSHGTTGAVTDYIRTYEVGYYAALWRKIEKLVSPGNAARARRPTKEMSRFRLRNRPHHDGRGRLFRGGRRSGRIRTHARLRARCGQRSTAPDRHNTAISRRHLRCRNGLPILPQRGTAIAGGSAGGHPQASETGWSTCLQHPNECHLADWDRLAYREPASPVKTAQYSEH